MSEEKQKKPQPSNKPVVTYIMILFIAAFLLMALSFLIHQRSNTEALGQLQNSVTAMQEVQATQEANIALQQQLTDLQEELDKTVAAYDGQLTALVSDVEQRQLALDAMTNLYLLQQSYSAGEYEACMELIRFMEENAQVEALLIAGAAEGTASDGISFPPVWTSPELRFQQLKEATETRLAQSQPTPAE
jgi:uroporphyrin-3 C-methyltransferase